MSRIDLLFSKHRANGSRSLIPFLCGGYPSPDHTAPLLEALDAALPATIIEVGLPYSDPVADGPVIAHAMHAALGAGASPLDVISEVASIRGRLSSCVVAMMSISIVMRLGGPGAFAARLGDAGFDGMICPDAPLEESGPLIDAASHHGLSLAMLIAPTTPVIRAAAIAKACTGFVYLLARAGVTGERSEAPDIAPPVARLRAATELPIACGFGIATPEHVRAVTAHADAAIVGSAMVRRIGDAAIASRDPITAASEFARHLATGLT